MEDEDRPLRCANCHALLIDGQQSYLVRVQMMASPGPLELTPKDLTEDHIAALEKLVAQMEHLDAEEAADEVHEAYEFTVCGPCRRRLHEQLRALQPRPG